MLFRFLSLAALADHLTNFVVTPRATDDPDFTRGYRQALKDAGALVRMADLPPPTGTDEQRFLSLAPLDQVQSVSIQADKKFTYYLVVLAAGWYFEGGDANGMSSFAFSDTTEAVMRTTRARRLDQPMEVEAEVAAVFEDPRR